MLVESEERLDAAMADITRSVLPPVLRDLTVSVEGAQLIPGSTSPSTFVDAFGGAPCTLYGRYRGHGADMALKVTGTCRSGQTATWECRPSTGASATRAIWARAVVRDLEDAYVSGRGHPLVRKDEDLEQAIVSHSLRFGVLSKFTAFVAAGDVATGAEELVEVLQPVELPSGWTPASTMLRGKVNVGASHLTPTSSALMTRNLNSHAVSASSTTLAGGALATGYSARGAYARSDSMYSRPRHSYPAPGMAWPGSPYGTSAGEVAPSCAGLGEVLPGGIGLGRDVMVGAVHLIDMLIAALSLSPDWLRTSLVSSQAAMRLVVEHVTPAVRPTLERVEAAIAAVLVHPVGSQEEPGAVADLKEALQKARALLAGVAGV